MYDIERLQESLDSGTIEIPRGLTNEERRAYVRAELAKLELSDSSIPNVSVKLEGRSLPEGMSSCIVGFIVTKKEESK